MDKIASEEELRSFRSLPEPDRKLNEALKGVLKETALTGVLRYPWYLVNPLLRVLLREVLQDFHAEALSEVGPARPLLENETVQQVLERFLKYLDGFTDAPWTVQRLCEVLLEPHKQYSRLHKVVMAIEKLLLVTGEVPVDASPPPAPTLASLGPVNDNPPPVYGTGNTAADLARKRLRTDEESSRITSAVLTIKCYPADDEPGSMPMEVDGLSERRFGAGRSLEAGPRAPAARALESGPRLAGRSPEYGPRAPGQPVKREPSADSAGPSANGGPAGAGADKAPAGIKPE